MNYSIAIDGPAGAGKSTIAKRNCKKDELYICRYRCNVQGDGGLFQQTWHPCR